MLKNKLKVILITLSVLLALLVVGGIAYEIYDFMNDYRCSTMPINEFFQDNRCKKYWRYRENER